MNPGLLSQLPKLFRATTACEFLERHADLLSERVSPPAYVHCTKVSLGRTTAKHKALHHTGGGGWDVPRCEESPSH